MNKMTVSLDIPKTSVERIAAVDASRECQCPICGRLHHKLANLPASISDELLLVALEEAIKRQASAWVVRLNKLLQHKG